MLLLGQSKLSPGRGCALWVLGFLKGGGLWDAEGLKRFPGAACRKYKLCLFWVKAMTQTATGRHPGIQWYTQAIYIYITWYRAAWKLAHRPTDRSGQAGEDKGSFIQNYTKWHKHGYRQITSFCFWGSLVSSLVLVILCWLIVLGYPVPVMF